MAVFKFVILENDHYKTEDESYNLKIRVSWKGQVRYISTTEFIKPTQIDKTTGWIQNHPREKSIVAWQLKTLSEYMVQFNNLDDAVNEMTCQDLKEYIEMEKKNDSISFYAMAEKIIKELRERQSIAYADSFDSTIRSIKSFEKIPVLTFANINYAWLKKYELHLIINGCKKNSVGVFMRNIRTVYNRAIKELGVSRDSYPFLSYKIPRQKTAKRNLKIDDAQKIFNYTPVNKTEQRAKDLFLLSLFFIGMNFKDLLFINKKQIQHNVLSYPRSKTGHPMRVTIQPEAWEIINRYPGEKLLLNIMELKQVEKKDRTTQPYIDIISQTNKVLKRILNGKVKKGDPESKNQIKVSTYFARHSWSTYAAKAGVSKDIRREALGHAEDVTDIYTEIDQEEIDKANRLVIDYIKKG